MRTIYLLLLCLTFIYSAKALNNCVVAPKWRLGNVTFPNDFSSSEVKLVAFLKASCGFCRTQAQKLGELRDELAKSNNNTNIAFLIVNSHHKDSYNKLSVFRNVTSVPAHQDTKKVNVWKTYGAETDDMLIFDKCNRLVFHLQLPEAVVTNGKVKESILQALIGSKCGKTCPTPRTTTKKSKANMKKTTAKSTTTSATTTTTTISN